MMGSVEEEIVRKYEVQNLKDVSRERLCQIWAVCL